MTNIEAEASLVGTAEHLLAKQGALLAPMTICSIMGADGDRRNRSGWPEQGLDLLQN